MSLLSGRQMYKDKSTDWREVVYKLHPKQLEIYVSVLRIITARTFKYKEI
jgi:hypothetical protein